MPRKNVRFVKSNSDLFQSCHSVFYETSSEVTETSSSYFTRSRQQKLPYVPHHKQPSVLVPTLPDFSSYEKFELIVESENGKENTEASGAVQPSVAGKGTLHQASGVNIAHAQTAAFCSTPANRGLLRVKNEPENHVVSLGDIQATPIPAPVFIDVEQDGVPYTQFEQLSLRDRPSNRVKNNATPLQQSRLNATGDVSVNRMGKHSDAFVKRISRRLRIDNMILNQSYWELYDAGDSKATLMKICQQAKFKRFTDVFTPHRRQHLRKIGEGCFGEVFACPLATTKTETTGSLTPGGTGEEMVAVKLVPLEGKTLFNGDSQKTFSEVLSEVIVSKELTALGMGFTNRTDGFVQLKNVHLVQGGVPRYLVKAWESYDRAKSSENDHPRIFPTKQIWVVIESLYSGQALEDSIPACPLARLSIVHQVAMTLAVAEADLKFEHRDLHWGNVLVRSSPPVEGRYCAWCQSEAEPGRAENVPAQLAFRVDNREYRVPSYGVSSVIIDFTLSRLEQDGGLVYVDLSADPGLFESQGDYQFDIYRIMRADNGNQWKKFSPLSNIRWLHYLVNQLLLDRESAPAPSGSSADPQLPRHEEAWRQLVRLHHELGATAPTESLPQSAYNLVTRHPFYAAFRQQTS